MKKHAFSLVELSIVLVILGLLVGGILSGQSLIRAAEIRAASTEYSRYITALQIFRDKYFAVPGDMNNAQTFWGVANATPATCITTAGTGTQTCNGDGNGHVDGSAGSAEYFRAWQHLANAGLIEGNYTGVAGSAGYIHHVLGGNCPRSRVANTGWGLFWQGTLAVADTQWLAADYGNVLFFGNNSAAENDLPNNPILTATEAWNIDTKMDDGKPNTGKIITHVNAYRPSCINTTNDAYLLTDTTQGCNLFFLRTI